MEKHQRHNSHEVTETRFSKKTAFLKMAKTGLFELRIEKFKDGQVYKGFLFILST